MTAKSIPSTSPQKIATGNWDANISWEFYIANQLPPQELCTAVFCLAFDKDDNVVLTKTRRGWEMLGGHIEPGESPEQALFRETHEEGGYTPQHYALFGYRKITSKQQVHGQNGRKYPFPVSYIPHFIATSNLPLDSTHGEKDEIIDSGAFTLAELYNLEISEIAIIESALYSISKTVRFDNFN